MKKDGYVDYSKSSEYFSSEDNRMIQQDIENIEKQKQFIVWIQSFSKRIVVITFGLYLIATLFSLFLVFYSMKSGYTTGIDTLISEINLTFRDVIGGYIIKSATENSFKIIGNYFIGISDAKLRALEIKQRGSNNVNNDTENDNINNDSDDEDDEDFDPDVAN